MDNQPQPLAGIKIIDFTQAMLGPIATQMLADYGADVIKIERLGSGDLSRWSVPRDESGGETPVFRSMNRNKKSIALDLRAPKGKEIAYALLRDADVVVNNFRAGVMERMGFGHEVLSKMNPRIISAFGSGFGLTGPLAYKGGQDVLAQAMSGVMMRKSRAEDPISIYATCLCDYTTGMHLTQAILLALLQRFNTGKGQSVSVSLFESMLAMQVQEAAMWLQRQQDLNWGAFPLTGVFSTSDGALVLVGAFKTDPLGDIAKALDLPNIKEDPRFASYSLQVENKSELHRQFAQRFSSNTTEYWLARLEQMDLLCAPVLSLPEALEHEQTKANGTVITSPHDHSRSVAAPLRMQDGAFQVRNEAPALGEHTTSILKSLGYTNETMMELRAAGTIG